MITDKIEELLKEVENLSAKSAEEVEQLRLKYLSKKGAITALMAEFRDVPADQKKTVGMKINKLKQTVQGKINELKEQIENTEDSCCHVDLTCTPYPIALGARHPLTIVKNEIIDIFSRMGFTLADGPEMDDDKHVFTMLNFAADHPARDMQDTFFLEQHPDGVTKNILLRSHTSGDQSHYMECHEPPIRIICPGREYRSEAISVRAHCFFHQVEGLYVDRMSASPTSSRCCSPSPAKCSAPIPRFVSVPATSPSLSPVQRWTSVATSAAARDAVSASTQDGLRFWDVAWSTPMSSRRAA